MTTTENIRTITTNASLWTFDLETKEFVREPLDESVARHPSSPSYTGETEPFTDLTAVWLTTPTGSVLESVVVHRPVPFGTGALRQTGTIISHTFTEEDFS